MDESRVTESVAKAKAKPVGLGALTGALSKPWVHAFGVAAITLLAWLRPGISASPILWDHAYFTYLEQSILLGEPIYANSFMGYPPLGMLVPAAAMWIGQCFDLPNFLAPRYLAVPLGAASAMLMYGLVRHATGSAWVGILGGISLASIKRLSGSSLVTLEPKVLLIFFCLLACTAVQRRRWFATGLFSGLAASCWQPAVLIPIALGVVAIHNERTNLRKILVRFCAGGVVAIVPSAVYFIYTDSWQDFWIRSVLIPANAQLSVAGTDVLHWIDVGIKQFPSDVLFFAAAFVGFAWYGVERLRRTGDSNESWLSTDMGGLPPLTLVWVLFNSFEFQNNDDMFPFFPHLAFWVAWLGHCISHFGVTILVRLGLARKYVSLLFQIAFTVLLVGTSYYGFRDGSFVTSGITLAEEIALMDEIVAPAGRDGVVLALNAEAVYVMTGRRSPTPYLRLTDAFMPFLESVEPGGCEGFLERIRRDRPAVVLIDLWSHSSECEKILPDALDRSGYAGREVRVGPATWLVHVAEPVRAHAD